MFKIILTLTAIVVAVKVLKKDKNKMFGKGTINSKKLKTINLDRSVQMNVDSLSKLSEKISLLKN